MVQLPAILATMTFAKPLNCAWPPADMTATRLLGVCLQVVRTMLAAVHQLTDALAALRVTLELTQHQQQQQPAARQLSLTPGQTSGQTPGQTPGQPEFDPGWHSWLLFDQLAALVHADISAVLAELQQLAALVGRVVRQPGSNELQAQLRDKVRTAGRPAGHHNLLNARTRMCSVGRKWWWTSSWLCCASPR
jgi:hypothetical protein